MPCTKRRLKQKVYATLQESDGTPAVCIASTKEEKRCTHTIGPQFRAIASKFRQEAIELRNDAKRHEYIAEFVLLRCCTSSHRHKLWIDEHGSLNQLVLQYGAAMGITLLESSLDLKEVRRDISRDQLSPYIPLTQDPMRALLYDTIPSSWASQGDVYCLSWRTYPKFLKLGFSGCCADCREAEWQVCHPGAELEHKVSINYPRRVEQLIHQELSDCRHRTVICKSCRGEKCHKEWFKISLKRAKRIVNDWYDLVRREPLYDADGIMSCRWYIRISRYTGTITAKKLRALLDAEEANNSERNEIIMVPPVQSTVVEHTENVVAHEGNIKTSPEFGASSAKLALRNYHQKKTRSRNEPIGPQKNLVSASGRERVVEMELHSEGEHMDMDTTSAFEDESTLITQQDDLEDDNTLVAANNTPTRPPVSLKTNRKAKSCMTETEVAGRSEHSSTMDQLLSYFRDFFTLLAPKMTTKTASMDWLQCPSEHDEFSLQLPGCFPHSNIRVESF